MGLVDIINNLNNFLTSNILMWGLLGAGAFLKYYFGISSDS